MSQNQPGIYSGKEFGENQRQLKRQREEENSKYAPQKQGNRQDTIFRDKTGKQIDVVSVMQQEKAMKEGQKRAIQEAQEEWGKGTIHKKEREDRVQDLIEIASEPFARTTNDPKLEKMRKEVLRDGDPMAEYFLQKEEKQSQQRGASGSSSSSSSSTLRVKTTSVSGKPLYKGPNPTPNRFNIHPGYRWDAIDRSNGFEKKVLLKISEKESFNEDEYKWRVSDL